MEALDNSLKKPNSETQTPRGLNHYRNKEMVSSKLVYFPLFLFSAKAVTTLSVEAPTIYKQASHTSNFSNFQGTIVMPSGRFPSDL